MCPHYFSQRVAVLTSMRAGVILALCCATSFVKSQWTTIESMQGTMESDWFSDNSGFKRWSESKTSENYPIFAWKTRGDYSDDHKVTTHTHTHRHTQTDTHRDTIHPPSNSLTMQRTRESAHAHTRAREMEDTWIQETNVQSKYAHLHPRTHARCVRTGLCVYRTLCVCTHAGVYNIPHTREVTHAHITHTRTHTHTLTHTHTHTHLRVY